MTLTTEQLIEELQRQPGRRVVVKRLERYSDAQGVPVLADKPFEVTERIIDVKFGQEGAVIYV